MRFRAGLFLSLFIALVGGGCRKPLAPTFDRNQAPETWITAAPMDTLMVRDPANGRVTAPEVGSIAFRFHMYWAGSDPDGSVSGFYYAVTETLTTTDPTTGVVPSLPAPKARDYKYTSRTDTTLVFSVVDDKPNRRHAFYIYAVDNLGKPDPTPARFIFDAIDHYPPLPIVDQFLATGFIWSQNPVTLALTRSLQTYTVSNTDTFAIGRIPTAVVPSGSRLDIRWHSEITTVANHAVGYRYKLDEPQFVNVDSSVTSVTYNSSNLDRVGPGLKIFSLRAVDAAGGARETRRMFQMNFTPDSWFAGADTLWSGWTRSGGDRSVAVSRWPNGSGVSGSFPDLRPAHSYLSPDSAKVLPSQRLPYKSFLSFYGNQIFCVREFETVRMNSWVLFFNGGFDPDSPYNVVWKDNDPLRPDTAGNPVVQVRPSNGSPIGFRARIPASLTGPASFTSPSQTSLYPVFDPSDIFYAPNIGTYWTFARAGTYYAFARAQDGDGLVDNRIGSSPELAPDRIVHDVDSTGSATPDQIALRHQILVFKVDFSPYFVFNAAISPRPGQVFPSRILNVAMVGNDIDPFDPAAGGGSPPPPGGPSAPLYRYTAVFRGPRNGGVPGDSVTYAPASFFRVANPPVTVSLPDSLGGTSVRCIIELCDCATCEINSGEGRCSIYSYLVTVPAPPPPPPAPTATSAVIDNGRGAAAVDSRRRGER